MKIKFYSLLFLVFSIFIFSQTGKVGINTTTPTETLHVKGNVRIESLPTDGTTNIIYTTTIGDASTTQDQTFIQDKMLVVDKNGVIGKAEMPMIPSNNGPTKFISGILLNRFGSDSGGQISPSKIIGGAASKTYSIGTATSTSKAGGIEKIIGTGYKVSQVSNGVFDIMFDTPFTEIYSLSANVYDTGTGATPVTASPQSTIDTRDQLQISYLSNSIIRIKTGNSGGGESARSFTFSVSGK